MVLFDLMKDIHYLDVSGSLNIQIEVIQFDSRKIKQGDLFVAINGFASNGHDYINQAIENGAHSVICEELPELLNEECTYIKVKDSSIALARLSSIYYSNPSSKLRLVGVTGTNGKTTIASLLYNLFKSAGYKVGLLSTVVNYVDIKEIQATHTTPDVLQINYLLSEMVDVGCEFCFMEVSSHALDQNRVANLDFDGGIFTNITHDHLDYHNTFSSYIKAKKKFFDNLSSDSFVITNIDDKNGILMLQNCKAQKYSYSIKAVADYRAKIIERHFSGMLLEINGKEVWTNLIGDYNISNLLSVFGTAIQLGMLEDDALKYLSLLQSVAGRLDTVISSNGIMGIVDYAHTPDALKNVLENIVGLKNNSQSVITVIGAGGDRDKLKRPKMASIAAGYSDKLILTSDNPRSENPSHIIEDMKSGLNEIELLKTISITDRKEAIKTSVMFANRGDIILIAGKGHESYQEVDGLRTHFNDKEIISEIFNS